MAKNFSNKVNAILVEVDKFELSAEDGYYEKAGVVRFTARIRDISRN